MLQPRNKAAALFFSAIALGACVLSDPASAQAYPSRPVRFVIPFPAGSSSDITLRPIAEHMSGTLGQSVVLDFRPGGGSMVAALHVKSQPADGYTFFIATNALVAASLKPNSEIDIRRDYTPIVPTTISPLVIAVNSEQIKATNLKELIDEARAKPGQINYASYGVGSGGHVFMELLLAESKTRMVHVPYQGSVQAATETAAGRVQVTGGIIATVRPHVASLGGSGKLRLIAVSLAERSPLAADVPGMREVGFPQIDFPLWGGLVGPPGMPRNIVDVLGRAGTAAYKDPKIVENSHKFGSSPIYGGPEELARIISREYEATSRLIREAGLKLE
jgi:tripartite-type tricarboxylate transporter receptor subunit TctC